MSSPEKPRVHIVSFPRSGHHALMGFLNRVSDLCDEYCEFYNCITHNGKPIECSKKRLNWRLKGDHCGAGKRITKTHDFDLGVPLRENRRYIVQYRHPLMSIQSWYELESRKKKSPSQRRFARKGIAFWRDFIDKWVLSTRGLDNVLTLKYQDLGEPDTIERVVEFCGGEYNRKLEQRPNFSERRDPDSLPEFMRDMERPLRPLMQRVGIEPLFDQERDSA